MLFLINDNALSVGILPRGGRELLEYGSLSLHDLCFGLSQVSGCVQSAASALFVSESLCVSEGGMKHGGAFRQPICARVSKVVSVQQIQRYW